MKPAVKPPELPSRSAVGPKSTSICVSLLLKQVAVAARSQGGLCRTEMLAQEERAGYDHSPLLPAWPQVKPTAGRRGRLRRLAPQKLGSRRAGAARFDPRRRR